jgi:hypothetical protein
MFRSRRRRARPSFGLGQKKAKTVGSKNILEASVAKKTFAKR